MSPTAVAAPPAAKETEDKPLRFLTPDACTIHTGSYGALHVTVKGERIYGGVYAAQAFPVGSPGGYVSLIYTGGDGDAVEIGIIRDLDQFPPAQAALVRQALDRRYFIHRITRIRNIRGKYGMLALDVDTDKGPSSFLMRWSTTQALSYGQRGKVLMDVDENVYLVPDVEALPRRERSDFRRFIYW